MSLFFAHMDTYELSTYYSDYYYKTHDAEAPFYNIYFGRALFLSYQLQLSVKYFRGVLLERRLSEILNFVC